MVLVTSELIYKLGWYSDNGVVNVYDNWFFHFALDLVVKLLTVTYGIIFYLSSKIVWARKIYFGEKKIGNSDLFIIRLKRSR